MSQFPDQLGQPRPLGMPRGADVIDLNNLMGISLGTDYKEGGPESGFLQILKLKDISGL